jgi:hypothetical protein
MTVRLMPIMRMPRPVWSLACACLLPMLGCEPAVPAGKVKATGIVRVGGAPLSIAPPATGSLNFAAKQGGESGTASIGPDGSFSVILSPGIYAVAVIAKDGIDTMDENGTPVVAKSLVAEKYGSTATSGLEVTVTQGGAPLTLSVE